MSTLNETVNLTNGITATTTPQATACTGINNGQITVTPTSGTGPWMYSVDGNPPVGPANTYTFTGLTSGPHNITVTDVALCTSGALPVTIAVGPGADGNFTTVATTCPTAANGSITVNATQGTAPFTYQLDSNPFVSGGTSHTFTPVSAGPHTVIIRDNLGCERTLNLSVPAGPILTFTSLSANTTCSGATNGSIRITPTSGLAPYTITLDAQAPVVSSTPYTFNNVGPGLHSVTVTDAEGCATTLNNIPVGPGPVLSTTANATNVLCNGGSTGVITVAQPAAGTAPYEYSLDNLTWQTSNTFSGLSANTYTVYFRESNGCQNNLTISVGEPATLAATTATVPVVCNGERNGIITTTSTGGIAPYEYSNDGGTTWQSNNVFNVGAGPYTITIRDANGCITTQSGNMTEPAPLDATSANGQASCDGGDDGVITVTANGGNAGYQYSINGVNYQSSNVFNVGPGNYTVNVKDNLGCEFSFPTTVLLGNNFTLTPQVDPTICEGTSVQLDLQSNATVYTWTPATGLSATNIHNPVANPTTTTEYIVTATLGRCSGEDRVTVNVHPAPIPDAGAPGFICFGQTYTLHASGGTQYLWTPGTYLDDPSSPNPVSTPTKDITYTLSILSDVNGCKSLVTDEIKIDVTPPIKVKTYPFDTVVYSTDVFPVLAVPSDSDVITYTWTPTIGLSDPTSPNPTVTAGDIGDVVQYRVETSTLAGCKGQGFITVKVYKGPDIYVPTAFTPNNDGKNDKFIPFPVGIKNYNYFRVYNRWGQLVYSGTKLNDGWDGRLLGKEQATGTFVWMIEGLTLDNKVIRKKGTVTLIR